MARAASLASSRTRTRRPFKWGRVALWVGVALMLVLVLLPLAYMLSASFTPESLVQQWPIVPWPRALTLNNYRDLFNEPDVYLGQWFFNSLLITGATTIFVVTLSAITAYGFARLQFPGRDLLFYICLATLLIPFQTTLLPIYLMMRYVHLLNTYWSVILPPLSSVFGTFLLRQFFLSFPRELEEAAIIDGCGKLSVLWRVILPNSASALSALALLTFLGSWNDVFWPLIALSDQQMYTLPVGLALLNGEYSGTPGPGLGMAAAVIGSAAILVFYLIFQRHIVQGVTTTGLKG